MGDWKDTLWRLYADIAYKVRDERHRKRIAFQQFQRDIACDRKRYAEIKAWAEEAAKMISDYQQAMRGLNRRRMTDHAILAEGVTVTSYEGGAQVYVNYGTEPYAVDGVQVPARSYLVTRGDQ